MPFGGITREPGPLPNLSLPTARRRYSGVVVSLLVHTALLALIVFHGDRLWKRVPSAGAAALFLVPGGGGGGGSSGAYITLPSSPRPAPQPPTPAPPPKVEPKPVEPPVESDVVPEPELPVPTPQPMDSTPAVATADSAARAGGGTSGTGGEQGSGTGEGKGPGIGPGAGEGKGPGVGGGGGVIRPPELRDLALPFDNPPKELRGTSLDVMFWVRADGRVERYEVRPAITDRDYARKFDEVIRAFRFTPARAPDGTRIAGTTRVVFTLPGKRSS